MGATRKSRSPEDSLPPAGAADPVAVLARQLAQAGVGAGTRLCLALSGGLDSSALLHALCMLRPSLGFELRAAHVDHGLQAASGQWARQCQALAERYGVPLDVLAVAVPATGSLEAQAREARYAALAGVPCQRLLLAHHRDDQAESVLLALLRGSGPAGLAAMGRDAAPSSHPLHDRLLRPWLSLDRASLAAWARRQGLAWIEDPSNGDLRLDRNFLRHGVAPLLERRFPGWRVALARTAHWCAETQQLLDELAALDLAGLAAAGPPATDPAQLPGAVADWLTLPEHRGRNLLRSLLARRGVVPPPGRRLAAWWQQLGAAADRLPALAWNGVVLRRWGGRLWLEPELPLPALPLPGRAGSAQGWPSPADAAPLWWQPGTGGQLDLAGCGRLAWHAEASTGAPVDGRTAGTGAGLLVHASRPLRLTACLGSEGLRLVPGGPTRELRKLFQERGVPPWRRTRMPALRDGDRLVAVAGLAVAAGSLDSQGSAAWRMVWQDAGQWPGNTRTW